MQRRQFFKFGIVGMGTVALTKNVWALKYYPMPSEKKWAVMYGTWCGSSRDAAVWISEGMDGIADVFDVRENPDLKGFDHIVIGGSIRGGVTSKALQAYITANKEWVSRSDRSKPRCLLTTIWQNCARLGIPRPKYFWAESQDL
jgi:hypothetical protein